MKLRALLTVALALPSCSTDSPAASSTASGTATETVGSAEASDAGDAEAGDASSGAAADETGGLYHPIGFSAAAEHGPPMKLHAEDCRTCHGDDLKGGSSGVGCDSCHTPDWRTDCVFCHGGTDEGSGAPPRDLDGTTDVSLLSFVAHKRHVTQYQHAPYDCVQCHRKPTDVLSEGHIFDDTPAVAEVDFLGGLSPAGSWDGDGQCSSLYCHGNGRAPTGSYAHDATTPSCGGCHPFPGTENLAYASMSGEHARHAGEGISCTACHDPLAITAHVDGKPDVLVADAAVTYAPATNSCNGLCHLKLHGNEAW